MKYIDQIKKIEAQDYIDEDGESGNVKLEIGLTEIALQKLRNIIPGNKIPSDYENLLKYTKELESPTGILSELRFSHIEKFFQKNLLGLVISFGEDGIGGCWVQEIKRNGCFGKILFVGHDPAVLIKQANNLEEFLDQYYDFLLDSENSFIGKLYGKIAFEIHEGKGLLIEHSEVIKSKDLILQRFANEFNQEWYIADLRNAKNGEGFLLESNPIRLKEEEIWAIKKYKPKESWILKTIRKIIR